MFIKKIHEFITFLKNQGQTRYHSPEEIDDAVNRASSDLFRKEHRQFENTQRISDSLQKFKAFAELTLVAGKADLPEDYVHATNFEGVDAEGLEYEGKQIRDGEWTAKKRDVVCPPETEYPIFRIAGSKIEVLPITTVTANLYYLKYPAKVKYNYVLAANNRDIIFNEAASVDADWPEIMHNELIAKTLGYLGINLKEGVLMQFEQLYKQSV